MLNPLKSTQMPFWNLSKEKLVVRSLGAAVRSLYKTCTTLCANRAAAEKILVHNGIQTNASGVREREDRILDLDFAANSGQRMNLALCARKNQVDLDLRLMTFK